jgi:phosphate transport system substrate-binding protein
VTYTWLLLYKQYTDEKKRAALKAFVSWGLTEGQRMGRDLGFVALPENAVARATLALETIR